MHLLSIIWFCKKDIFRTRNTGRISSEISLIRNKRINFVKSVWNSLSSVTVLKVKWQHKSKPVSDKEYWIYSWKGYRTSFYVGLAKF